MTKCNSIFRGLIIGGCQKCVLHVDQNDLDNPEQVNVSDLAH